MLRRSSQVTSIRRQASKLWRSKYMNFLKPCGMKMAALASTALLCGSMGLAQMQQSAPGAAGGAPGQGQGPGQTPSMDPQVSGMQPGQPSPTDRMFVSRAMQGGMAEVQLAQLTLQKSDNVQVKQFAQQMIDDHTKLSEQMKPVAQQLGCRRLPRCRKKTVRPWRASKGFPDPRMTRPTSKTW